MGAGGAYVIDTGFTAEMAKERKRTFLRCPIESLTLLGVEAGAVRDVILTHMHYDHVGNFHKFPNARFHLQEREMAYATGKYMRYPSSATASTSRTWSAWCGSTSRAGWRCTRARWRSRPASRCIRPTATRTACSRCGCTPSAAGWCWPPTPPTTTRTWAADRPFTTAFHIGQMLDAYRTLERLAPSPRHIVPGHDPYVMKEYPAPKPALEGIAVRLDVEPTAPAIAFPVAAGH